MAKRGERGERWRGEHVMHDLEARIWNLNGRPAVEIFPTHELRVYGLRSCECLLRLHVRQGEQWLEHRVQSGSLEISYPVHELVRVVDVIPVIVGRDDHLRLKCQCFIEEKSVLRWSIPADAHLVDREVQTRPDSLRPATAIYVRISQKNNVCALQWGRIAPSSRVVP